MTDTPATPAPENIVLERREEIRDRIATMIESAQREIVIFAPEIETEYFSSQLVARLLASFAARHRRNRARILTEEEKHVVRNCVRLVNVARQFSEFVSIRAVGAQHIGIREMFVVVDSVYVLHQDDVTRIEAVLRTHNRSAAGLLIQRFNEMWEYGSPVGEVSTAGL
jgi:sugar-specific transcriptional regulator TrmB